MFKEDSGRRKRFIFFMGILVAMMLLQRVFAPAPTKPATNALSSNAADVAPISNTPGMDLSNLSYPVVSQADAVTNAAFSNITMHFVGKSTWTLNPYLEVKQAELEVDTQTFALVDVRQDVLTGPILPVSPDVFLQAKDMPVYEIWTSNDQTLYARTRIVYRGQALDILRSMKLEKGYRFVQDMVLSNASTNTLHLNDNGYAFSMANAFAFAPRKAAQGNVGVPELKTIQDDKLRNVGRVRADESKIRSSVAMVVSGDNFFTYALRLDSTTWDAAFRQVPVSDGEMNIFVLAHQAFSLEPQESRSFHITGYLGPRDKTQLQSMDSRLGQLFAWWPVVHWFLAPLELGTQWLIEKLALFIPNRGWVIIVVAFLVKLILSPLSIRAAMSVKHMHTIQPKVKKLEEKYRNDKELKQRKLMELYQREKVNPLGGCLPLLFQLPVFFVLYRVLSHSLILKEEGFLWIKDLTQPDVLFRLTLPWSATSFAFHLLPLIMVAFQVVTMHMQQMRMDTSADQQRAMRMNKYLMPIMFLFLFWNMPSGLVLYWTVQNIYTILEQKLVNVDKHIS